MTINLCADRDSHIMFDEVASTDNNIIIILFICLFNIVVPSLGRG